MSDKYAETQRILGQMADIKMEMNSHKGNIEDAEAGILLLALESEVEELNSAVSKGSILAIIEEAADIQNFLIAITHQQITKYRNRK